MSILDKPVQYGTVISNGLDNFALIVKTNASGRWEAEILYPTDELFLHTGDWFTSPLEAMEQLKKLLREEIDSAKELLKCVEKETN